MGETIVAKILTAASVAKLRPDKTRREVPDGGIKLCETAYFPCRGLLPRALPLE